MGEAEDIAALREWYTMSEIAGLLGVSRRSLYGWLHGVHPAHAHRRNLHALVSEHVLPLSQNARREAFRRFNEPRVNFSQVIYEPKELCDSFAADEPQEDDCG